MTLQELRTLTAGQARACAIRHGRGLCIAYAESNGARVNFLYLPVEELTGWPAEVVELVRDYDPSAEAVIAAEDEDGAIFAAELATLGVTA